MHSGDLLRSPLCITITLFYFSSRPLYLSIWRLSASIERSTASSKLLPRLSATRSSPGIWRLIVATLFPSSWSLSSFNMTSAPIARSTTVEFVHFVLYEFDQLPVGVEFYGLNLYVHNTMFYKVRYLRNCAPADQFCCFVCSAPFFSRG